MPRETRSTVVLRACALIESWVGVKLNGAAPERLYEFLERRASTLGFYDPADYVSHAEKLSIDAPEARRLVNLVTNGLTAFWRDTPQLDAVALAMKQIASNRDTQTHPVSIWCAGCATGEEAYTLSMLAHETTVPTIILGTDVNSDFLSHARDGHYGEWSLRRLDARRAQDYFVHRGDGDYDISASLRQRVYFRQHNLLEQPPLAPSLHGWDLILCRNVLIYFAEFATRRVIENFASVLQHDGYLMLGSSEQLSSYYPEGHRAPFRAAKHGAGFVYRLSATPPGATIHGFPMVGEQDLSYETLRDLASGPPSELDEDTVELDQREAVQELLETGVQYLMKSNDSDSALACFEAAASYDPFVPNAYFLIGLLLRDNARKNAIDALRKALFLNPFHWLASFELARLHEGENEIARARLAYRQTLEGLEANQPLFESEIVADLFGMDDVRARQIYRACQEALSIV